MFVVAMTILAEIMVGYTVARPEPTLSKTTTASSTCRGGPSPSARSEALDSQAGSDATVERSFSGPRRNGDKRK